VPIGAWTLSLVFDLVSRWSGEPEVVVKASFWLIGAGILAALLAAVFGLLDLRTIPRGTPAFTTGLTHPALNYDDYGLGFGRYRFPAAQVVGHHGVWGAFAFWCPELDASSPAS
jgi:uncharacterized membrane protein